MAKYLLYLILGTLFNVSCILNTSIDKTNEPKLNTEIDIEINGNLEDADYLSAPEMVVEIVNPTDFVIKDIQIDIPDGVSLSSNDCTSSLASQFYCSFTVSVNITDASVVSKTIEVSYKVNGVSYVKEIILTGSVSYPGLATVEKVYPNNGANWNDYVDFANLSMDKWSQNDSSCVTAAATSFNSCIHGAERLKVYTGQSACTNLSLTESLSAFEWVCHVVDDRAYFFSRGLKEGKGLSDLIDSSGWKNNQVSIYKNSDKILESDLTVWWNNQVLPLPDNSATDQVILTNDADGIGKIYFLETTRATKGYALDNKMSIVSLGSATLRPPTSLTASICGMNGPNTCIVYVNGKSYNWIEINGMFTQDGVAGAFVLLNNVKFFRVNNTNLTGNSSVSSSGLYMDGADFGTVLNFSAAQFNVSLHSDSFTDGGLFKNLRISNSSYGIYFEAFDDNNTFQNIQSVSNAKGMELDSSYEFRIIGANFINNSSQGLALSSDSGIVISGLAVNSGNTINNLNPALSFSSADSINVTNYAALHSPTGIFSNSSNIKLSGVLMLGNNNLNCNSFGPGGGIINDTCADTLTDGTQSYSGELSNALLRTNRTAANSFFGKISSDDIVNNMDTGGIADYVDLFGLHWLSFENLFRFYGKLYPASLFGALHRGICSSDSCEIYDWRIKSVDNVIRNTSSNGLINGPIVNGQVCPPFLNGNSVETSIGFSSEQTYLKLAMEITLDDIGDDDGLCESNESCLYMPNFGSYQGHGSYSNMTCNFQDGTISNVEMHFYPINGYVDPL